ncbi:RimJ/RimL family protein N-acetyltransferase [Actinopolyspora lacussalsi]|nr:RimJ/RimL family protein N-acetyltransferase [Actinopolyspora lacussalsi]
MLEHTADLGSEVAPVLGALVEQAFADGSRRVELRCSLEDVERARAALGAGMRYEGITREPETLGRAVFSRLSHDVGTPIPPCFPELQAGGLSDGVVRLRVTHPEDARALYEEQANPEAKRFALVEPLTEWDIAEKAVRARMEWLTGPQGLMTIVDAATGQPAGKLALRSVVPPKVADVGYGVLPAYRGRGFAARALKLATTWALRGAGYSRLELGVKPENQASLAVALAAGYLPDGVRSNRLRNLDGTFSDEIHFAATESALNLVTYA